MPRCPYCGREFEEGAEVCTSEAVEVAEETVVIAPQEDYLENTEPACEEAAITDNAVTKHHSKNKKKKEKKPRKPLEDKPRFLIALLSFIFPIGLILYIVYKNKRYPKLAHQSGKWTVIGFITAVVLAMLGIIIITFIAILVALGIVGVAAIPPLLLLILTLVGVI